jgi:hypothetical protein
MNRLSIIILIGFALASCNRRTGLGNSQLSCADPIQGFLGSPKQTTFFVKTGNTTKDSFIIREHIQVTDGAYRMSDRIMPRDCTVVMNYIKPCGGNIYIASQATDLDEQHNLNNLFMKGSRKKFDKWKYSLNNLTYNVGVADTNLSLILLYDTIKVDKIWRNVAPQNYAPDTFYWSDKYGQVLLQYPGGKVLELLSTNIP